MYGGGSGSPKHKSNIIEWGGTKLTPRDITQDIQMLQNLDDTITNFENLISSIFNLQSELYLGIRDLSTTRRLMIPSGAEIGIDAFTVQNFVDVYGTVRVYDEITVKSGGVLILRSGASLVVIEG